MEIVNNSNRLMNPHEKRLIDQNWKWVNINTINPTQFSRGAAVVDHNGRPDRLNEHSHHSESTHFVISGDLRIQRTYGPRLLYEISDEKGAKRQDHVLPKTRYRATSRRGCTFVEGHRCLSPESAERFISRGTLKVVDKRARRFFPTNDQLGIWLRQVKFDPNGKARPAMGEMPILDTTGVSPTIPDDVHADISQWFENEWRISRNDRQVASGLWSFIILILCVGIAYWF
ncbi:hypothetical protein F4860DRAFT_517472 [Xylaria cubensis]|nr:hypothetical protein F4860DRAFT_517472 [Xylaria cubensis]